MLYIKNENIRPPEFYPTISQRMGMYASCSEASQDCFPIAEALQVRGCSNTPGFAAMIRGMQHVGESGGPAEVEKHIIGLSRQVKNIILSQAPHCMISSHTDTTLESGLTVFFPFSWDNPQVQFSDQKTADWVVQQLLDRNIQIRSIGFSNSGTSNQAAEKSYALRVSTGYFNTAGQVQLLKTALRDVLTRLG